MESSKLPRDRQEWHKTIKETILYLFINHVCFLPLVLLPYYFKNESLSRVDFETLPGPIEVIAQTVFFMIVEENKKKIDDILIGLIESGVLSEDLDKINYDKIDVNELEEKLKKEFGEEEFKKLMNDLK